MKTTFVFEEGNVVRHLWSHRALWTTERERGGGSKRAYRSGWSDSIVMNAAGPESDTLAAGSTPRSGSAAAVSKGAQHYDNGRESSPASAVACSRSEQETHKICLSNRCRRCFSVRTAHARRSYLSLQKMWFSDILPPRRRKRSLSPSLSAAGAARGI